MASLRADEGGKFLLVVTSWITNLTASTTPFDGKFSHQQMSNVPMEKKEMKKT